MAFLGRHWCRNGSVKNFLRGAASSVTLPAGSLPSSSTGAAAAALPSFSNGGAIASVGQSRGMSTRVDWHYGGQRRILPLGLQVPDVAVDAWVAPNAVLSGNVIVQDKASIWYGVVLRGDLNRIKVGGWSSIGDRSVLHAASSSSAGISNDTDIGKFTTIGAQCTLRSCIVEDDVVVGQRCIIMEGSIVEKHAMLASGSVVPPGRLIPAGEVWAGNPARFVRVVTNDEIGLVRKLAEDILAVARTHADEFLPYGTAYLEVEKLLKSGKIAA